MSRMINKVPFLSILFRIANAYALKGHPSHFKTVAPLSAWCHRIGKNLLLSILVGSLCAYISGTNYAPQDIILSIFPSILGFGIGVFALLFALPNEFLDKLKKSVDASNGASKISGPEMLASDMAYPLLVYVTIMFFAVIVKSITNPNISFYIASTFLVYGSIISLELINSIFMTSSYMLIVRKKDNHPPSE